MKILKLLDDAYQKIKPATNKGKSAFLANPRHDFSVTESATPKFDLYAWHNYKVRLEKKLKYFLDLKAKNQWKLLNKYELEKNAITVLLTLARKFREDDGIDSKIITDYVTTFNTDVIQMIRGIEQ